MNKKQRNRKIVTQNKRNRIINRKYSSTIKSLSKLLRGKLYPSSSNNKEVDSSIQQTKKIELSRLFSSLSSILDKATKKRVIHKNKASRKKSIFQKLINSL